MRCPTLFTAIAQEMFAFWGMFRRQARDGLPHGLGRAQVRAGAGLVNVPFCSKAGNCWLWFGFSLDWRFVMMKYACSSSSNVDG
jgi:hypothetical protein